MFNIEEIRGKTVADIPADGVPEELRGLTPDQIHETVQVIDAKLRDLNQGENGELRHLDANEQQAFDYLIGLRGAAIKRLEQHRSLVEVLQRETPSVKRVYANIRRGIDGVSSVARMPVFEARDEALRRLEDRSSASHLKSDEKDEVDRLVRRSTDVARRILVTENEHYRSAFAKAITDPWGPAKWTEEERDAMRAYDEYRAMSSTGADGGYGIPVFIDPSIIMTAQGSGNPFLELCDQVDVNTNEWKGVSSAGVSWRFRSAEGQEAVDASPTLAQPNIEIHTAEGFVPFSIEIGQDYPGFMTELQRLLAEGYDELLVDKFTRGSGTNEPAGILTVLSANAAVRVPITTSGSAFGPNDPYKVAAAVPQRFRRRASWLMSVDVNNKMRQLAGSNVYHAFTENLTAEWADRILGRTAYESPYMPDTTTGTAATTGLAVLGDFRAGYRIARRAGMAVELISHLFHTSNNLPKGERGLFAWARIGADSVNDLAFRLLVNTG